MNIDLSKLTSMEEQVIRLAASGLSLDEVAESLEMAPQTARNHAQKAGRKLGYKPLVLIKLMAA